MRTLASLLLLFMLGCNNAHTIAITVLLDQTEPYFNHVGLQEIKKISGLNDNFLNGVRIKIKGITESSVSRTMTFELNDEPITLLANKYIRRSDTAKFFRNIHDGLIEFKKECKQRNGSAIFHSLVDELNILTKEKVDQKICIINSDMIENSSLSFTSIEMLEMMKQNPFELERVLTEKYPIDSLNGIDVFITYIPQDRIDGERFEIVSKFYLDILQKKGADVHISGNLN